MRISDWSSDVCSSDLIHRRAPIPSAATIGYAAPAIVLLLRVMQGLALGGEYGGAAIYVSEHSPPSRRGFFTGFIQASVVGGFVLSLVVVLGCKALMSADRKSVV